MKPEATQVSTNRSAAKPNVAQTHSGVSLSLKKEALSSARTWTALEDTMLTEIASHKGTNMHEST